MSRPTTKIELIVLFTFLMVSSLYTSTIPADIKDNDAMNMPLHGNNENKSKLLSRELCYLKLRIVK